MNLEILKQLVGCTIEEKDGAIVIIPKKEEVKESLAIRVKDGDILSTKGKAFIFNGKFTKEGYPFGYCGIDHTGRFFISKGVNFWTDNQYMLATESEAKDLFAKMKKAGKQWNAEKKRIENYRDRADNGSDYYVVTSQGNIYRDTERGHVSDNVMYNCGNYFLTEQDAKESALYKAYIR